MPPFSAVLFDLGNTLVYRIVTQERTLRLLCDELNVPLQSEPDWAGAVAIWRAYHASHYLACRTPEQEEGLVWREARLLLNHVAAPGYATDTAEALKDGLRQATRWWGVYDDVPPVLDFIKSQGIAAGVVSNWEPSLDDFCVKMGLSHVLNTIVSSVRERIEKPSPRVFEIAAERLGLDPTSILYVGDDYRMDVVGSRAAGMTPVLVDRNDRYLTTDCIKIQRMDEIIDILQGHVPAVATAEVCFSGFSL